MRQDLSGESKTPNEVNSLFNNRHNGLMVGKLLEPQLGSLHCDPDKDLKIYVLSGPHSSQKCMKGRCFKYSTFSFKKVQKSRKISIFTRRAVTNFSSRQRNKESSQGTRFFWS